jgi:hypothetical protein
MLNCVLSQAMNYLVGAIAPKGATVGADESFQFFVAALAQAQLFALPTILKIIDSLIVRDLCPAKAMFLASQLRIALQFIQSRSLSVPPYWLLPYLDRESDEIVLESEEKITLHCFVAFARPFTKKLGKTPPAVLKCTGEPCHQAIVYRYKLIPGKEPTVAPYYHSLPTIEGTICYIESNNDSFKNFIGIDEGSYEDRIEDIKVVSNLNIMLPPSLRGFNLECMRPMTIQFAKLWGKDPTGDLSREIIAEGSRIQVALKKLGLLPPNSHESGVLDFAALAAVVSIPKLRSIGTITTQVVAYLCALADDASH